MNARFTKPVVFNTLSMSFSGEGIPAIPEENEYVMKLHVGQHTTVWVAMSGETWESFNGKGTTESSQVYYWPTISMCPRAWVKRDEVVAAAKQYWWYGFSVD